MKWQTHIFSIIIQFKTTIKQLEKSSISKNRERFNFLWSLQTLYTQTIFLLISQYSSARNYAELVMF